MTEDWSWRLSSTAQDDFDALEHDDRQMVVARIKRRGGAYTADD